jgi:hypothetical protein
LPRSQHPRVHGLQRDPEGLEGQPLTRAHCHGGVLAEFPREMLKNGSRESSVVTEGVNRERAELDTPFPRGVIIHPEKLLYVRLSVEKGGCLTTRADASKSWLRTRVTVKHDTPVTSNAAVSQCVREPSRESCDAT